MKPFDAKPIIREHEGIHVVRDDLFPGGTKTRYIWRLFDGCDEAVYASPAEGGAQTALATAAAALGKRATIFVAARAEPHPRALLASRLGARVCMVTPGYLTVVQARARAYCEATGARLIPFGVDMPEAIDAIAQAARSLKVAPDEVWCASGSGVLARGLAAAWPKARRNVVQVGRELSPADVAGATIHVAPMPFSKAFRGNVPFPSDPHYDAKCWDICRRQHGKGMILMWNVAAPAP